MRTLIALGIVLSITIIGLVGAALFFASISSRGSDAGSIQRQPLTIVTAEGSIARLEVEIAETPEERSQGLSGRQEVHDDTGMLFILPSRGTGFWMENTLVPLSVAFLGPCGEIVDIQHMEPLSRELHNTDEPYNFGLEVPRGWFEANGVGVGDLVSIPRNHRLDGC